MKNYLKPILLIYILAQCLTSMGINASPEPIKYQQPNNMQLTILLKGDEFVHWATTLDGYTVLNNKDGYYVYAVLDSNGDLTFSDIIASDQSKRSSKEVNFVNKLQKNLTFSKKQIIEFKKSVLKRDAQAKSTNMGGFPTMGTNNMLMILGNFNNTTTTYSQADFNNYMNMQGFNNGKGSFKDFYLEVSYGKLIVNTTVTIWVTVPHPKEYYGPSSKWSEFVYDAVVAANTQAGVDFSQFDNNADGLVDGIAVIHQGGGQEATANPNDIWSHSWNLSYAGYSTVQRTFDGVVVDAYTTQPELYGSGSTMSTIGVMCHEFGHNLGAPDFYDTDYSTSGQYTGTGNWDLMSNGSWNGTNGDRPAHPNPWIKKFFSWITPQVLEDQQQITLRPSYQFEDAAIYHTTTPGEYFLLENRQKQNFDSEIPGHGMLIYHVDENYINDHLNSNDINNGEHQGLYQKAANSTNASGQSTQALSKINTSGCPFPGTSSNPTFNDNTFPHSRGWNGATTNKPLNNIEENPTTKEITFCFINCYTPDDPSGFSANAVSLSQIELSWQLNASNNPVLMVFDTIPEIGTPIDKTIYSSGDILPNGGKVLYVGYNTTFQHTSLIPGTSYYYKIFSIRADTTYSNGVTASAATLCTTISSFPYVQDFENNGLLPNCWTQENVDGTLNWIVRNGSPSGLPAKAHGGKYNALFYEGESSFSNACMLISPEFNLTSLNNPMLRFWYSSGKQGQAQDELKVYYKTSTASDWVLLETYNTNSMPWKEKTLELPEASSTYYIAFEGTEMNGKGISLDDISIEESTTIGIDKVVSSDIKVYPNPTTGIINIKASKEYLTSAKLSLTTLTGSVILIKEISGQDEVSLDITDLPEGVYLLHLTNKMGHLTGKVILTHR